MLMKSLISRFYKKAASGEESFLSLQVKSLSQDTVTPKATLNTVMEVDFWIKQWSLLAEGLS